VPPPRPRQTDSGESQLQDGHPISPNRDWQSNAAYVYNLLNANSPDANMSRYAAHRRWRCGGGDELRRQIHSVPMVCSPVIRMPRVLVSLIIPVVPSVCRGSQRTPTAPTMADRHDGEQLEGPRAIPRPRSHTDRIPKAWRTPSATSWTSIGSVEELWLWRYSHRSSSRWRGRKHAAGAPGHGLMGPGVRGDTRFYSTRLNRLQSSRNPHKDWR
jgi:hypothetical protein